MSDNQQLNVYFQKIQKASVVDEVKKQLIKAIKNDSFDKKERLPSEPALAEQFGVSRNTIREVLNSLSEQGLVFRKRGIGTFLTPQLDIILKTDLNQMSSTTGLLYSQNKIPGQKKFKYRKIIPSKIIAKNLNLSDSEEVMEITRIRTIDGEPAIYAEEFFPLGIPHLDYDLSKYSEVENWSIYNYFVSANYVFDFSQTTIHAFQSTSTISKNLQISKETSIICLEQIHFCNNYPKPLLFSVNYHNDKKINIFLTRSNLIINQDNTLLLDK